MAKRDVVRKALAIFLPVFVLLVGIGAIFYFFQTGSSRDALEEEERLAVGGHESDITHDIESATSDLMFLAGLREVAELFREDGSLDPGARAELNEKFLLLVNTRELYDQVRLLDENGMEIVRVNFNQGDPAVVPESELQNKAGRYYFGDTLRLDHGDVFVSPLDLNIEHGEVEQPLKPMIRLGTPIIDERGDKRGIIVLNYLGGHLLETLAGSGRGMASQSMLLNSDGYYLKGPNPEDEWGFMYEGREDRTFGLAYPTAWQRIESDESGQFETAEGLFTFTAVYPLLEGQGSSSGAREASGPSAATIDAKGYEWKIVRHVPATALHAESRALLRWMLAILAILALLLAVGSLWLARARVANRRSQEELRKASAALAAAANGVVITDKDGIIEWVNPAFTTLTGYLPEEVIGQNPGVLKSGKQDEEFYRRLWETILSGHVWHGEIINRRKDGSLYTEEQTITPVPDERGEISHFIAIKQDITERKRAEEETKALNESLEQRVAERTQELAHQTDELRRSNVDLEQFVHIASHDLQEPLRMVTSYTQLLAQRCEGKLDSDADDFIAYAVGGAKRMQGLIQDLLTYSRVARTRREFEPADCETALQHALADMEVLIEESGAVVTHDALPTLTADPVQLGQVFQNLVENAIKFRGADPPRVHVSAEQQGDDWVFSVRDNGIGIAPEYAERIFVIFQRLHGKEEYPGTGMGLTICKKIIEGHGGRIWVESEAGEGATFHFALPSVAETRLVA